MARAIVAHAAVEVLHGQVAQGVGLHEGGDLSQGHVGGDEVLALGRVDAVEAGVGRGRAGDAHVHLRRTGLAHHLHDLLAGGATHDAVVHQHHALARQQVADRVQLHLHAEAADGLFGLDEGAPDVVVADDAEVEGDAGLLGVAQGRADATVRHRHHQIRFHGMTQGQAAAHLAAGHHDALAEDQRIGPGEVDVLEHAGLGLDQREREPGAHPTARAVHHHHLAGRHVPLVGGTHQVEGAGLGAEGSGAIHGTHGQGPEAPGIPGGDEDIGGEDEQREGAASLAEGHHHSLFQGVGLGAVDEGQQHLAVRGAGEGVAVGDEAGPQGLGVGQVAVVAEGHLAEAPMDEKGVGGGGHVATGGGVAGVPDGGIARQGVQDGLGEHIRHVALGLVEEQLPAIAGADAGGLLAPVLEGIEAQVGLAGGLDLMADPENPAFIPKRHASPDSQDTLRRPVPRHPAFLEPPCAPPLSFLPWLCPSAPVPSRTCGEPSTS